MWRSENASRPPKDATVGALYERIFLAAEDPPNGNRHLVDCIRRHMRAHWQAKYGIGQSLRQRISAPRLAEIGIGILQMGRNRIMNKRANAGRLEGLHEVGAAGRAH